MMILNFFHEFDELIVCLFDFRFVDYQEGDPLISGCKFK